MNKLSKRITAAKVSAGHVLCSWLGGSGFVFKTAKGTVVYLDAYLSDAVVPTIGEEIELLRQR
jgi:L-ascorbate metabolism protein UlaG (beta-lactamase superfamily)